MRKLEPVTCYAAMGEALNALGTAVAVANKAGRVIYTNDRLATLAGTNVAGSAVEDWLAHLMPEASHRRRTRKAMADAWAKPGRSYSIEFPHTVDKRGDVLTLRIQAWATPKPGAMAFLIQDVTHRSQAESDMLVRFQREISANLHDRVAQTLFLLQGQLRQITSTLEEGRVGQAANLLRAGQNLAATGIEEVRCAISCLRGERLLHGNADVDGVLRHAHDLLGLNVTCRGLDALNRLELKRRICMTEALRELLTNVHKHAGVKQAQVEARVDKNAVTLCVSDAGRGMKPATPSSKSNGSMGLKMLREKMEGMGGKLEIAHTSKQGTKVTCRLPLT